MKNVLLIVIVICINSCRMPADPLGEIKIIKRGSIDTIDNCRDLDVDIVDDILVAAANYAGYFVYDINREGGIISGLTESFRKSSDEMDEALGDNQAEAVKLSTENNIAFILDKYENIWLYKYGDAEQDQFDTERLQTSCEDYGAAWLSVAIDDQKDSIGLYFLLNHHTAESMDFCISQFNYSNNISILPQDERDCSDIQEYFENYAEEFTCEKEGRCEDTENETIELDQYNDQSSCEEDGHVWKFHEFKIGGCLAGDFAEYSTSLVWKKLDNVAPYGDHSDPTGDPDCEYIANLGSIAEKIYFNDGILSITYGGLGVKVFEQSEETLCSTYEENGDLIEKYGEDDMDTFCEDKFDENFTCCISDACDPNADCEDPNYILNEGPFGLGGKYSSKGGIIPQIYSEFDTPGEVETVYSINRTIFAGLSHSNGCIIKILNDNGKVIGSNQFAVGYTIKGIHEHNGLLALAAGNDGILLYNWNGGADVSFMGKIETAYANNVKVAGDIIFAATEDGIEFIQIDR